jgi:hypothetical protein
VPSPIGHLLGGAAVAWGSDAIDRRRSPLRVVAACALLATAPDLDLLVPHHHRSFTHSLTAVLFVLIVAASVTGRVNRWRIALVCACAYGSHLLLDWLGADTLPPFGLQLFWPFDSRFFVSGLNVFAETERRNPLSGATIAKNLWAVAREVAIVAPVAGALWLVRVKALARLPAKVPSRDHAPQ